MGSNGKPQQTALDRAARLADQWKAQADEHKRRPSFRRLSPGELVELARNTKRLSIAELEALDEAWFEAFGELLILSDSEPCIPKPEPNVQTEPEPVGDPAVDTGEVLRMTGLSVSTLKRMVLDGRFPQPRRPPGMRRINWTYSDVKRWLDDLDANRRQGG